MDLLKKAFNLVLIKNGKVAALRVGIVLAALGVGVYLKFFSSTVDSAIEQAVESVLKEHGIDIDFSADKKKQ